MSLFRTTLLASGALIALANTASADFRYAGSPKFGQFYMPNSSMSARAELLPDNRSYSVDVQPPASKPYFRKGGIGSRGI